MSIDDLPSTGVREISVLDKEGQLAAFFGPQTQSLSNFGSAPAEQREYLWFLADGGEVADGAELIGKTIRLRYWYLNRVELERDGEIINAIRCVLIDDEYNAWQFVSAGIIRDLMPIVAEFRLNEIKPPALRQLVARRTRQGFNVFRLLPVPSWTPPNKRGPDHRQGRGTAA